MSLNTCPMSKIVQQSSPGHNTFACPILYRAAKAAENFTIFASVRHTMLSKQKKDRRCARNMDDAAHHMHDSASQPLLDQDEEGRQYPPKSMPVQTRPRSKSKPDAIFIHPTESNIARADAAALEMGLAGDTELVKGHSYMKEEPAWEIGKGKDLAREMLVGAKKNPPPPREPFFIGDEYDSD